MFAQQDVQYKDSGELLDEQPAQQRKTAVITVIPQVMTCAGACHTCMPGAGCCQQ